MDRPCPRITGTVTTQDIRCKSGRLLPRHPVAVVVLGTGVLCTAAGWIFAIIGPRGFIGLGAVGFLASFAGMRIARAPEEARKLQPAADRRRMRLQWMVRLLGLMVILALVVHLVVGGLGGSAAFPVLERREAYALNNHGSLQPVPRWRYVAVGASFATGWTSLVLIMNLSLLYKGLYGRSPL